MGEWRKPICFKCSEDERRSLAEIHAHLGFHENPSQTLRWCVRVIHNLIFTEGSLQLLLMAAQAAQWTTPYYSDKQLGFQFAPQKPPLLRFLHAANERRQA